MAWRISHHTRRDGRTGRFDIESVEEPAIRKDDLAAAQLQSGWFGDEGDRRIARPSRVTAAAIVATPTSSLALATLAAQGGRGSAALKAEDVGVATPTKPGRLTDGAFGIRSPA